MREEKFDFENLLVWQKAVNFADSIFDILEALSNKGNHFRLKEQMESACTSISLNIAEGKGRYFDKEYLKFLYYSRGSLYETITLLQIFKNRGWLDEREYLVFRKDAIEIGKMLNALIRSIRGRL